MIATVLFAMFTVTAQAPPSVQGAVVKMGTNEPILKATVELRQTDAGEGRRYTAMTQNDGRFAFRNIPDGQYDLSVSRQGYVKTTYGERRPGGPGVPIVLPGQAPRNLQLAMTPTGIISGRILDRDGYALVNATVQAMKVSYVQGVKRLSEVQSTFTDDLGEYRLFWLTPGRYYVGAIPTVGPRRGVGSGGAGEDRLLEFRIQPETTTAQPRKADEVGRTVYFPGTLDDPAATPIDVMPGAEVQHIDFIAAPVRTHHIRGVVVSAEPAQALTGSPTLRIASGSSTLFTPSPTTTFDVSGIFPGPYLLTAELNGMAGTIPIELRDQDLTNVIIPISRGFSLSGQVIVEGRTASNPGPDLKGLRLSLRHDPETGLFPTPATLAADGSFVIQPLYTGNYRIFVSPQLQNAYLKSIRFEEREVIPTGLLLDRAPSSALTVVINVNGGTVSGTVVDDRQQPMPNAVVVLVPEGDSRSNTRLFKNITTDRTGQFRMQAITPGIYRLFAWQEVENGAWLNAEFLSRYEDRGAPVEIGEGETRAVLLQAILD